MKRSNRELGKTRVDDEYETSSGRDNAEASQPERKKPYHRPNPEQIQEMEAFFKENPHPNEEQRQQLSSKLRLEPTQIKFWFQNRRAQLKARQERDDNATLRGENQRLKMEIRSLRLENTILENELAAEELRGRPYPEMLSLSSLHNVSSFLTSGGFGVNNFHSLHSATNLTSDFLDGLSPVDVAHRPASPGGIVDNSSAGLADATMNELIRMAR